MTGREFPRSGLLILGVLSLVAAVVFVTRAAVADATGERIVSAIAFGAMGMLWLGAYLSGRVKRDDSSRGDHDPSR